MPAQGFISRQINRSERSHLPQPIYVHFPEGSYHLFLSWMLYSQEQIRFSQNMLLIAPVKLNQRALADFDKLCPTLVMENRTLHLLCPVAFTRILCEMVARGGFPPFSFLGCLTSWAPVASGIILCVLKLN